MKNKYICNDCSKEFSQNRYEKLTELFCPDCGGHIEDSISEFHEKIEPKTNSKSKYSPAGNGKSNSTDSRLEGLIGVKENVGVGIMGLAWITASILGLVIHVWTIVIAFSVSGLFAAVLTLVFPVLSEIYWFFKVGSHVGFVATYCVAIMAYVGLFGIAFLGAMVASSGD